MLPATQSQTYTRAAEEYQNGRLSDEGLFDYSPLYLQAHVTALRFFKHSNVAVQWLQIVLAAGTITLFFLLALRFFPLWLSVTATIALMMQRSLIVYTQLLEPSGFIIFFLLLFLYFAGSSLQISYLLAGCSLSLVILTNPNFAPLIAFIPIYYLITSEEQRPVLKSILLGTIPSALAISLLVIWMAFVTGYFSLTWMNPGINIYEANNPLSLAGTPVPLPMIDEAASLNLHETAHQNAIYNRFARSITGMQLTFPEVNRYWRTKAIYFWKDHPDYFTKLAMRKVRYFFHDYQWHETPAAFWNESYLRDSGIPTVPFAIVSAMAIAGLFLGWKQWRKWFLIYATFISHFVYMIVVNISAQQRILILPLFFFFLCAAVSAFYTSWKKLIWVFIVLPLIWIFYSRTELMNEETRLRRNIRISTQLVEDSYAKRSAEEWQEASESASRSLAAAPFFLDLRRPAYLPFIDTDYYTSALAYIPVDTPQGLFGRGVVCIYANRPGEAEISLREVLKSGASFKQDQYQSSQPFYFLARSSWLRGNKKESENRLREALNRAPGDPWCLAALATITQSNFWRNKLFRYFDDIDAQFFLSEAALKFDDAAAAVPNLYFLAGKLPESRRMRVMLAAGLSGAEIFTWLQSFIVKRYGNHWILRSWKKRFWICSGSFLKTILMIRKDYICTVLFSDNMDTIRRH